MQFTTPKEDFFIYICAYRTDDEEEIKIDVFDEDDTSLYYDVSGYELSSGIAYSIASSCYSDFLQFKIDDETLRNYSAETILAHCFWEVTAYGFEDNI